MNNNEHECCGGHHNEDHECCGGHHDHDHNHGDCGCGHDHEHEHEEYQTIQLSLEDGREITAAVLEVFELDGKEYIALLPLEEENALLYQFKEYEDGIELINIESDEEFDAVSQAFLDLVGFDEEE